MPPKNLKFAQIGYFVKVVWSENFIVESGQT